MKKFQGKQQEGSICAEKGQNLVPCNYSCDDTKPPFPHLDWQRRPRTNTNRTVDSHFTSHRGILSSTTTNRMSNKSINPPSPRYLTILCEFMAFVHEKAKPYPKDHEVSLHMINTIIIRPDRARRYDFSSPFFFPKNDEMQTLPSRAHSSSFYTVHP